VFSGIRIASSPPSHARQPASDGLREPGLDDIEEKTMNLTIRKAVRFASLLLTLLLAKGLLAAQDASYTFTAFDFPGLTGNTWASGINDRGQIVGGYFCCGGIFTGHYHGFLFDRGEFTTIDVPFPGALHTEANGINNRGQIVGIYVNDTGRHGFLYDDGVFSTIDVPFTDAISTDAFGINDRGEIVGRYDDGQNFHGFLYSQGEFSRLDAPFSQVPNTIAYGINNRGQIVGGYGGTGAGTRHAFVYDRGEFTTIDAPLSDVEYIAANAINDRGVIGGTYCCGEDGQHGFLYDRTEFVTIDVPPSLVYQVQHGQQLRGITNAGALVGSYSDNRGPHGYFGLPETRTKK
jgi:probable HAF family extracellular repeat protein